ncbi:hypothetical protein SASPL_107608 [Salvia splendens]|uniref:Uncharacterized protein n=1 Tax=Salvia splendens TaxID=180675 RepID=A0A8X8YGQ2_SALSN|nr:hypothetical protein SASPL_107608 [Salvia splendens]
MMGGREGYKDKLHKRSEVEKKPKAMCCSILYLPNGPGLSMCSTQVRCAMNCQFCYTMKMGFMRNTPISAAEIVEQSVFARRLLSHEVVFMFISVLYIAHPRLKLADMQELQRGDMCMLCIIQSYSTHSVKDWSNLICWLENG